MSKILSRNPATQEVLAELDPATPQAVRDAFARAREAQKLWRTTSIHVRAKTLLQIRETILQHRDEIVELIVRENGKPHFEALANELLPSLDMLTFFAKKSAQALKSHSIPMQLMLHRKSSIEYWPVGTVAIISPWNYPWLLPIGQIMMALVAGNAVIFKPSEITPLVGLEIQRICDQAGLPANLLQTLVGGAAVGQCILESRPDKVFFTGSEETGKKILAQAAQTLTPVNLELGGKDPMIVLSDANLDFATSAAIWGGLSNAGQMCASVERIFVHESIAPAFEKLLLEKVATLRQGPSSQRQNDLGPITLPKQKAVYEAQIEEAKKAGVTFLFGGALEPSANYCPPTILSGPKIENLSIFQEETFGPILPISTFRTIPEVIEKANSSKYGLLASVITSDLALGEQIAQQLECGSVLINEVSYTAGLGETPWGGIKHSGMGRSHSLEGLKEFCHVRHIHSPRAPWLTFKSFWWFPYTPLQYETFAKFTDLYSKNWLKKLLALPEFLYAAVRFIKFNRRL